MCNAEWVLIFYFYDFWLFNVNLLLVYYEF